MGPSPAYEERVRNDPKRCLPYAIGSGHAQLVLDVLKEDPALLHERWSGNATPLLTAAYAEQHGIAESLLAMGARMDFITAVALNRSQLVRAMLEEQPSLILKHSPVQIGCMQIAARYAAIEMLRF